MATVFFPKSKTLVAYVLNLAGTACLTWQLRIRNKWLHAQWKVKCQKLGHILSKLNVAEAVNLISISMTSLTWQLQSRSVSPHVHRTKWGIVRESKFHSNFPKFKMAAAAKVNTDEFALRPDNCVLYLITVPAHLIWFGRLIRNLQPISGIQKSGNRLLDCYWGVCTV